MFVKHIKYKNAICLINFQEMHLVMKRAKSFLIEKLQIREEYLVAAYLCPNIRHLRKLAVTEREKVEQHVRDLLNSQKDGKKINTYQLMSTPLSRKYPYIFRAKLSYLLVPM